MEPNTSAKTRLEPCAQQFLQQVFGHLDQTKVFEGLVEVRVNMAQAGQQTRGRGNEPDTGQVLDRQHRTVQSPGSGEQRDINLTDFGRRLHGIDTGDQLSVMVCEEGIWITTDE